MKIFARGEKIRILELKEQLATLPIDWEIAEGTGFGSAPLKDVDMVFDLNFDEHENALHVYAGLSGKPVVVSAVKKSLSEMAHAYGKPIDCILIGINALPTFLKRSLAEISLHNPHQEQEVINAFTQLNWQVQLVKDRVGMVTPRVVFMVMNEACYTVQEGTATIKDIDTGMKLGTNYPMGPFEWCDRIGVKDVFETLEAVYQDTHDERYKICPLLKSAYLHNQSFYTA